jgi:hypothetical protein
VTNAVLVARRTFRRVRGDFRQEQGISLAEPIVDLPNTVSLVTEERNDSRKLRAAQTKNLHDLVAAELAATNQIEHGPSALIPLAGRLQTTVTASTLSLDRGRGGEISHGSLRLEGRGNAGIARNTLAEVTIVTQFPRQDRRQAV